MPLKQQLKKAIRDCLLSGNYYCNNYREVLWLVGDGRSGTTWIADLINQQRRYREMFEPFHPKLVASMANFLPHHYLRPGSPHHGLEAQLQRVFNGSLQHPRVDQANWSYWYQGLLVKDIFANLLVGWARAVFPEVKPLLLLRHPFAVALSKYQKRHWFWVTEPLTLLKQPQLVDDFLDPYVDLLHRVSEKQDYILSQVAIWCVINRLPLQQLSSEQLPVIFYEQTRVDPQQQMDDVFRYLGRKAPELNTELMERPSRVVSHQAEFDSRQLKLDQWKRSLTCAQIDQGLEILQQFGLDKLYSEDPLPNEQWLTEWRSRLLHK